MVPPISSILISKVCVGVIEGVTLGANPISISAVNNVQGSIIFVLVIDGVNDIVGEILGVGVNVLVGVLVGVTVFVGVGVFVGHSPKVAIDISKLGHKDPVGCELKVQFPPKVLLIHH